VNDLLDLILLSTDLDPQTYEQGGVASGIVVTARLDKRRGIVAGVILENGTLRRGDYIATETASGKVKILENFLGKSAESLIPSAPALIVGFENIPAVGEEFFAAPVMPEVKKLAVKKTERVSVAENSIPVVIKADEAGSLEAFQGVIKKLSAKHQLIVIAESVGDIYETDVKAAESTGAVVLGFRVKVDRAAENLARSKKITLLVSPIVYELEKELDRYAAKLAVKEVRALEILGVFGAAKGKQRVVGGKVLLGPVKNQEPFEIWHEKRVVGNGKILNLQSGRKDISEAPTDVEVGMLVESEEPIKVGYRLVFSD